MMKSLTTISLFKTSEINLITVWQSPQTRILNDLDCRRDQLASHYEFQVSFPILPHRHQVQLLSNSVCRQLLGALQLAFLNIDKYQEIYGLYLSVQAWWSNWSMILHMHSHPFDVFPPAWHQHICVKARHIVTTKSPQAPRSYESYKPQEGNPSLQTTKSGLTFVSLIKL